MKCGQNGATISKISSNTPVVLTFEWKEGVLTHIKKIPIQIELQAEGRTRVIDYFAVPGRIGMPETYSLND